MRRKLNLSERGSKQSGVKTIPAHNIPTIKRYGELVWIWMLYEQIWGGRQVKMKIDGGRGMTGGGTKLKQPQKTNGGVSGVPIMSGIGNGNM